MEKCSFCGKDFDDFRIKLELNLITDRKKNNDTWERFDNASLKIREVICEECFTKFTDAIDALNFKKTPFEEAEKIETPKTNDNKFAGGGGF